MRPLHTFPMDRRRQIRGVFFDIDDTLSTEGKLTADAYGALAELQAAGLITVPITGRPAGWCDHIARMWPVDGVVGENGAFYFRYEPRIKRLSKRFFASSLEREQNLERLQALRVRILEAVPSADVASDQPYRESDLAIDICEDVPALTEADIDRVVALFKEAGANAKRSSVHVNGWFGAYDKLSMTKRLMRDVFDVDLDRDQPDFVFVGDSPNDSPMFGFFENAVGVANIAAFAGQIEHAPTYVTEQPCGAGFQELAHALLVARDAR